MYVRMDAMTSIVGRTMGAPKQEGPWAFAFFISRIAALRARRWAKRLAENTSHDERRHSELGAPALDGRSTT